MTLDCSLPVKCFLIFFLSCFSFSFQRQHPLRHWKRHGVSYRQRKQFYIDQIKTEKEKEAEYQERHQQEERDKLEEAFISQEEENISILNSTFDENTLNTSLNRSGRVHNTKKLSDISTQTDHKFNVPKIRINSKVCTDQVKSTCASVSTKCEVSVKVARLAVKTVMKGMYDHDVYLNTEEQSAAEQSTPPDNDQNEPPSKKKRTVPVPSSKADYDKYQNVLPTA